jgi:hypothetical protein
MVLAVVEVLVLAWPLPLLQRAVVAVVVDPTSTTPSLLLMLVPR